MASGVVGNKNIASRWIDCLKEKVHECWNYRKVEVIPSDSPLVEKDVIIGAGAAGSSAAIFAGQAGPNSIVVVDSDCNAQMALIHDIDNYPGILGWVCCITHTEEAA